MYNLGMDPHGFDNTGALDKPQDARDVKLGAATPAQYTYRPVLMDESAWSMPIEYQGQQPACGAHSGVELKDLSLGGRYSPRFTWADIKTFDGFPIESGTDMRSIFKSITKRGVLDFPLLGNDVYLTMDVYAHPLITHHMNSEAAKKSGQGYGFIADLSFDGLKQFIDDHGPTIVLLRIGKEWWTAANGTSSWKESDVLPVRPPAQIVSGHFVVAHSYDEQYIYFVNHWSDQWGRKGHGYFGKEYMPFVNDAGALFPLLFTKDLYYKMQDPDVKRLQQTLNKDPRTQVAASGAGSPGNETEYFGWLTLVAVKKFQSLHGVPNTGYVGPLTRAVLNTA